jgi:hypothetical protein
MKYIDKPLNPKMIQQLKDKYGEYIKLTVDLKNKFLVAGPELHADGEKVLLEKGGKSKNIWGGGIDLDNFEIDTTAVLNLRPNLDNESMEILDSQRRNKFINIVKRIFQINNE